MRPESEEFQNRVQEETQGDPLRARSLDDYIDLVSYETKEERARVRNQIKSDLMEGAPLRHLIDRGLVLANNKGPLDQCFQGTNIKRAPHTVPAKITGGALLDLMTNFDDIRPLVSPPAHRAMDNVCKYLMRAPIPERIVQELVVLLVPLMREIKICSIERRASEHEKQISDENLKHARDEITRLMEMLGTMTAKS